MEDRKGRVEGYELKPAKYNVLFMRDDRGVKRFRLSLSWIKFFVFSQVLLLILAASGGYFSVSFFRDNQELSARLAVLQTELTETRSELRRLENVRQILNSFDEKEVSTALQARSNDTDSGPSNLNLEEIFQHQDKQVVAVDHIQARVGDSKIRLRFELNNLLDDRKVSGWVKISLVARDGTVVDLDVQDPDLNFEINHFKKVHTSFGFHELVPRDKLFAIRLTITNEKKQVIYSETFPLSDIIV
ncbi:MAG: hypothetical protein ACLFSY_08405 [Desulfonatronovibrionaceae bacterium]